ncbi:MAG: M6 family metalloprotease domain-containing protein [Gemmatimonadetes bacterium]|nr:M6 family metalloprotease domain-containing protein [Gemmatimonadota bacterium]
MHRTLARLVVLLAVAALAVPASAHAQGQRAPEVLRNADGDVFDFAPDGAWRVLARRVAAQRRLLMQQGNWRGLNAAMAAPSTVPAPAAVSGVKKIPAILFSFADSARAPGLAAGAGDTSKYNQLLFSATAPTGFPYGTPYSIRSFYNQMSNGLLDLQGVVIGWDTLASPEGTYTGGQNCSGSNPYGNSNCNGIWSGTATTAMRNALTQAVAKYDGTVNFSQFDNDGPDGTANSGDDDGFVDMAIFIHSELDGACRSSTNQHLWSHRSTMSVTTNDLSAKAGFGNIRFRDYTLQSGVGGSQGCNQPTQIMSIGTAAHESGHAFGLPDLYDTQQSSEGIGNWGLMGSGNQSSGASPSRMEAWSLNELGWVTVRPITVNGTYSFGPAPTSDTTFLVRVQGTNTRKEYFLLENRQGSQSDTALIRTVCTKSGLVFPTNCHGGLAIWQVDSAKIQQSKSVNQMNAGTFHGLTLVQADNRKQLETAANRGDAGDLFPGYSANGVDSLPNNRFSFNTTPAANKHVDSTFIGWEISNITQVAPDGAMSFQIAFGGVTVIRAADTTAQVKVDGTAYSRFTGLFTDGSIHSISMDSAQTTADGKTQFVWVSWSDAGLRTHNINGTFAGDSISAVVATKVKVQATVQGTGTVASSPSVDHTNGTFVTKASGMTLTATPGAGQVFERWTGDTNVTTNPLVLTMGKPYAVVAVFSPSLAVTAPSALAPVMGKPYTTTLAATGGTGLYTWSQVGGAFPAGVTLAADGSVSGTSTVSGAFTANVRATSGVQTADAAVSINATEPSLTLANVLGALLGTTATLSTDDMRYLDLIGNKSSAYDVGDFLAWVEKTNAAPAAASVVPSL